MRYEEWKSKVRELRGACANAKKKVWRTAESTPNLIGGRDEDWD